MSEPIEIRRRPPRAEAEHHFQLFEETYAERLETFLAAVGPRLRSPAYSPESLDDVEALLLETVTDGVATDDHRALLLDVVRYTGEVVLRSTGGEWEWEELWEASGPGAGMPFVRVDSPDGYLRGGAVDLHAAVSTALAARSGHVLRDLATAVGASVGPAGPLRRSSGMQPMGVADPAATNPALRAYLAVHDAALERFVARMAERGLALDYTATSLDRIEQHLLDTYPDKGELTADYGTAAVQDVARYVAETFVRLGGGRINLVDPAAVSRPVTPRDALPYLERVSDDGAASSALPLSQVLTSAVRATPVGRTSTVAPRTGDRLRHHLERYATGTPGD